LPTPSPPKPTSTLPTLWPEGTSDSAADASGTVWLISARCCRSRRQAGRRHKVLDLKHLSLAAQWLHLCRPAVETCFRQNLLTISLRPGSGLQPPFRLAAPVLIRKSLGMPQRIACKAASWDDAGRSVFCQTDALRYCCRLNLVRLLTALATTDRMEKLSPHLGAKIRLATSGDAEAIFSVHRDSVANLCSKSYSPQQISMWLDGRSPATYLDAISRGEIFLAVSAEQVVGFVEAIPGEIVKLFIRGSMAGTGIGASLMNAGLKLAEHQHAGPICIESTKNAEAFYAKYGFSKVGNGVFSRGGSAVSIEVVHLSRPGA
jgi:putative acetyltransferase